jgi:hypothetical protein
MRIIDMRPERTAWKDGQQLRASSWRMVDSYQSIGGHVREIFHYSTKMGEYVGFERGFDHDRGEVEMEWMFIPTSIGHGSVSDQGGMNQLMSIKYVWNEGMMQDYGYRYHRDQRGGGARIEYVATGEVVVD